VCGLEWREGDVSARVLFIGLDAAEPTLLRAGMACGQLPTLCRLAAVGASGSLTNSMRTLPGAVWPEIVSGVGAGRLPRYFHPRQLFTGDAAPRPIKAADVDGDPSFYKLASDAGCRVAVVDLPHMAPVQRINGVQITEYGIHDRHFGKASYPPGLVQDLERQHGRHPVGSCDHYGSNRRALLTLLNDLLTGIDRKTALLIDLVRREAWDLFACSFTESHCAGHWFWHLADPGHWAHDRTAPIELRQALDTVYRRLDSVVGQLVEAADAATTIIVASHGMGPYSAGYQLVPEFLARLGLGSDGGRGRGWMRRAQIAVKHLIPRRYWDYLTTHVVERPRVRALLRPLQQRSAAMFFPLESPLTKAAYLPNNTISAIRLNVRGREPYGCVEPGTAADALLEEIRRELHALRDPRTGQLVVDYVWTAAEAFGSEHHPDVPDAIVAFRSDLGLIEACESPRVGLIRVPIGSRWARRMGDHSINSYGWWVAPDVVAGSSLNGAGLLGVAPTVLASLGCDRPSVLDGRPWETQLDAVAT
jgi:predicted AlkP superfamily phosphohydrolase/phosphomutase